MVRRERGEGQGEEDPLHGERCRHRPGNQGDLPEGGYDREAVRTGGDDSGFFRFVYVAVPGSVAQDRDETQPAALALFRGGRFL